jgi:hypothetical protein
MNATVMIALLIIGAIVSFVVLLKWVARSTEKADALKLAVAFNKLESRNDLRTDLRDTIHKRIIGLDKSRKKLLFIDRTKSAEQVHVLDLLSLASVSIVKGNNSFNRMIDGIVLECRFKDTVAEPVKLTFYDQHYDNAASLAKIEKKALCWHQTINIYRK